MVESWYVLLMFGVTVVNYAGALALIRPGMTARGRFRLVAIIVTFSLLTLGFFKYFVFFQENLSQVVAWMGGPFLRIWPIVLPVGISFYIFHC
ncbi:MAG: hypothetical protein KIT22_00070 [Verrucomicrobiae bacterium]|nr:hypothetical protein [Verrucomicrobiae bacterium]